MYVITGGGSGLGRALAIELALRGNAVMVVGRREEALLETANASNLIRTCQADVTTHDGRAKVLAAIEEKPLKGLINNAGILGPIASFQEVPLEDFRQTLKVHVEAPLCLIQQCMPLLKNGRILNISSGAAHFAIKGWTAYCVAKAALYQLTQCFKMDNANIPISSVMPGIIDTAILDIVELQPKAMGEEKIEFFTQLKQTQKMLTPACVATFLTWLLCEINSEEFSSKEWDIYDNTHHKNWLKTPHVVPNLGL